MSILYFREFPLSMIMAQLQRSHSGRSLCDLSELFPDVFNGVFQGVMILVDVSGFLHRARSHCIISALDLPKSTVIILATDNIMSTRLKIIHHNFIPNCVQWFFLFQVAIQKMYVIINKFHDIIFIHTEYLYIFKTCSKNNLTNKIGHCICHIIIDISIPCPSHIWILIQLLHYYHISGISMGSRSTWRLDKIKQNTKMKYQ